MCSEHALCLQDVALWCCQTRYADPAGRDYAGFAPLHESCATGNIDVAKILLAYGADVNVAADKDGVRCAERVYLVDVT